MLTVKHPAIAATNTLNGTENRIDGESLPRTNFSFREKKFRKIE